MTHVADAIVDVTAAAMPSLGVPEAASRQTHDLTRGLVSLGRR